MQSALNFDQAVLDSSQLTPKYVNGQNPEYWTKEITEAHIKAFQKLLNLNNKISMYWMYSYWQRGLKFYSEWLDVLNGTISKEEFDTKYPTLEVVKELENSK